MRGARTLLIAMPQWHVRRSFWSDFVQRVKVKTPVVHWFRPNGGDATGDEDLVV